MGHSYPPLSRPCSTCVPAEQPTVRGLLSSASESEQSEPHAEDISEESLEGTLTTAASKLEARPSVAGTAAARNARATAAVCAIILSRAAGGL